MFRLMVVMLLGASISCSVMAEDRDEPAEENKPGPVVKVLEWENLEKGKIGNFQLQMKVLSEKAHTVKLLLSHEFPKSEVVATQQENVYSGVTLVLKGKYDVGQTKAVVVKVFSKKGDMLALRFFQVKRLVKIAKGEMAGAYLPQDSQDKDVQKVASQAVELLKKEHPALKLVAVHEAATQVVAGLNYFLTLQVKHQKQHHLLQVVAYQDLGGNLSISEKW